MLSSMEYVSEFMYAANDADDEASTPDTKWYDPNCKRYQCAILC